MTVTIIPITQLRTGIGTTPSYEFAEQIELRHRRMDAVIEACDAEGRKDLRASEARDFEQVRREIDELLRLKAIAENRERRNGTYNPRPFEDPAWHAERRGAAEDALAGRPPGDGHRGPARRVRVNAEPLTYDGRPDGPNFLTDAFRSQFLGDSSAGERIARHTREMAVEYRSTTTSSFTTGLVIPQYVVDQFAPYARAMRPFLNAVGSLDLPPDGMTLNVPRMTTATATAAQASENTAVQNTDAGVTLLTVNVNTYAGQQDVSRQAIERGTGIGEIVLADLVADYHTKLDAAAINGAGSGGTHLGVLNTAGVNAVSASTATAVAIWTKIADAVQRVNVNRLAPADLIVMHPRRWGFFLAALDSAKPAARHPQQQRVRRWHERLRRRRRHRQRRRRCRRNAHGVARDRRRQHPHQPRCRHQ